MIDTLKLWDTNLFLFLNSLHAPFLNGFMSAISEKLTWIPLYISVVYIVVLHWKRQAVWVVLALILCIVIADQVSSNFIKDFVQRPRPSREENLKEYIHLVHNYTGGRYGFVSSHAANAVGFALLSSLLFKRKSYTIPIFIWAALTAYSRIYLGVHYPMDILGGAVVGVLSAMLCFYVLKKYSPIQSHVYGNNSIAEKPKTRIIELVLYLSFAAIIIYSIFIFQ